MAIKETLSEGAFWNWLQQSGSYKNNFSYEGFSYEGAKALFNYLDDLSEDTGEDIEFDPIAWCCEFSEFDDLDEIKNQYDDIETIEDLRDNTQVIELDNGHIIIQNF